MQKLIPVIIQKFHYSLLLCILFSFNTLSAKSKESATKVISKEDSIAFFYAFIDATKLEIFGNYDQAENLYKECLKVNPNSAASYYQLSKIFFYKGEARKAIIFAIRAEQLDTTNIWYSLSLAKIFQIVKLNDSVVSVYERIVQRNPNIREHQVSLANIYISTQYFDKAIVLTDKITQQYGFSEDITQIKINAYRYQGKINLVINELKMLHHLYPDDINHLIDLGEAYTSNDSLQVAKELYDKAFLKDSNDLSLIVSYIGYLDKIKDSSNVILYLNKIYQDSIVDLNTQYRMFSAMTSDTVFQKKYNQYINNIALSLLQNDPNNQQFKALVTDYYIKSKNYNAASVLIKELINADTSNAVLWEQLIYIQLQDKSYDSLFHITKRAINIYPTKSEFYFFNGFAAIQIDSFQAGIQSLNYLLSMPLKNDEMLINTYSLLGEAYYKIENHTLSDLYFEKAIVSDPTDLILLNNYSYYLSLRSLKLNRAEKLSKKTIKAEPNNPTFLDTYGWILFKMGKFKKAEKYILKAINNSESPSAEILDHYGDIQLELNNLSLAIEYWKKAFEIENREIIKQKIDRYTIGYK